MTRTTMAAATSCSTNKEVLIENPYVVEKLITIQSIIDKLKERAQKTQPGYIGHGLLL